VRPIDGSSASWRKSWGMSTLFWRVNFAAAINFGSKLEKSEAVMIPLTAIGFCCFLPPVLQF